MSQDRLPVPDVNDVEVAFGTTKYLPAYDAIPDDFKRFSGNLYVDAVSGLFFKGGRLADYGLRVRRDLDEQKVLRAVRAHLCSWEPKHEHKTAGVALMLHDWCEPLAEGDG